jgi:hypothetical protein
MTDVSKVDTLSFRYKFVNFGEKNVSSGSNLFLRKVSYPAAALAVDPLEEHLGWGLGFRVLGLGFGV